MQLRGLTSETLHLEGRGRFISIHNPYSDTHLD